MGAWGVAILAVGALILAVTGEALCRRQSRWDGVLVATGALLGSFVASEWLGAAETVGSELDGLLVLPALIGAVVVGSLAESVLRIVTPSPQMLPTPEEPPV